jgi:hypothetical protein
MSLNDLLLAHLLIGTEMIRSKETQLNGIVVVIDVESVSYKVLWHIKPNVVRKFIEIILVRLED